VKTLFFFLILVSNQMPSNIYALNMNLVRISINKETPIFKMPPPSCHSHAGDCTSATSKVSNDTDHIGQKEVWKGVKIGAGLTAAEATWNGVDNSRFPSTREEAAYMGSATIALYLTKK
jgi:hypothetical protein